MILGRRDASVIPSLTDKAYAAGLFDGEGHVTIAFMSSKLRTKGNVYTMRVGVSQNDPAPLLWIRDRWSGSVVVKHRPTAAGNHPHVWTACSKGAAQFLRDVLPYLQMKRRRADIALDFQSRLFIPGKNGHRQEYRNALENLRVEMTGLNTHKRQKVAA